MRRSTCCLLVVVFGSWLSSFGQSASKTPSKAAPWSFPRVVARFKLLGQTRAITPTTVFVTKTWGTFRISTAMVRTRKGSDYSAAWFESFTWDDGGGMESSTTTETIAFQLTTQTATRIGFSSLG
jgi:hypothetical protein